MLGLLGPAGLPDQTVRTLQQAIAKIVREPQFASKLALLGMNVTENGTAEYAKFMQDDLKRYSEIVERLHLRPQ
jgi:tripartite-type tricarboxylate transporter receptor subunit TctC